MLMNMTKALFATVLAVMGLFWASRPAPAQQVSLQSADGGTVTTEDFKNNKATVLSFGASWVPLVAKELPALQKMAERYNGRGVQVYWVSVNSNKPGGRNVMGDAELRDFAGQRGFRGKVLRDPEQAAYRAYGVDALPTLVILDRTGRVVRKLVGFDPDQGESSDTVMRELDQLLR